ncbi:MAG TPA: class I SAM-dependent methyltransferase [Streptosporangiaceae bacterium]|nr:class I SAM-dependent methyltransferase [Streptosporangiaceae bacterium]
MGFFDNVTAAEYARFMGRYSEPLAARFADLAGVRAGHAVLDVGCGPGALTAELVRRLGPANVFAVEPSPSFAAAVRDRLPGVDVRVGAAEQLPFADGTFDVTAAQLVVHFMADPVAGLREMARVTRPGGTVAACVWDYGCGRSPITLFWRAVREHDPSATDGSDRAGASAGHLTALFEQAGLRGAQETTLTVSTRYGTFEQWWETFELGIGPAGAYLTGLPQADREAIRAHCQRLLPPEPVELSATTWAVRCQV